MLYRSSVLRIFENYLKDSHLNQFNSIKRFLSNKMSDENGVFNGTLDRYNGITIDTENETVVEGFSEKLKHSLEHWQQRSMGTIWFKVKTSHAQIVPTLVENGFDFHHAKEGFVMMYKWLPVNLSANIPVYAHTMVGVGGLVVNDQKQILTIKENRAIVQGAWKLPGGYVEPNEHFVDAAIREVAEETGIETKFDSLVCVRHAMGGNDKIKIGFGCSDLYFVVALKPQTQEITKCEREIARCEWMDYDKYLQHPNVHQMNRLFLQTFISNEERGIKLSCKSYTHELLKRQYQIYSIDNNIGSSSVPKDE
ncbi:nudix hydrolase 2 [Contarinia nasturtii]|uniref:nudix hydrolase 2 n=1 Tax=Contarinia nasturtii TaxID=265458 RepID=UPI0012D47133|nr:nudix hydrolase 2 [Contarinia nasturtii]